MRDLFAEVYGGLNEIARSLYLGVINRTPKIWAGLYHWIDHRKEYRAWLAWLRPVENRLRRLIEEEDPDVLVAVYPAYAHLLDRLAGPSQGLSPKRVVVITDSISVNAIWFRCSADAFLLANEETREILAHAQVPVELLHVTGFPVDPRFAHSESRGNRALIPPWRILYMINAGQATAPALIEHLASIEHCHLTVTVGHNERLRQRLEEIRRRRSFQIIGWTNELPRLLSEHHLLIGKAGGATVQEAIAAGCPMIVNRVVPGQEEGNAELIEQTRAGRIALSVDAVVAAIQEAIADQGKLLREWATNIARMSRPDASLRIAEYLLAL